MCILIKDLSNSVQVTLSISIRGSQGGKRGMLFMGGNWRSFPFHSVSYKFYMKNLDNMFQADMQIQMMFRVRSCF